MNMEYSTEVQRNPTEIIKIIKRDSHGRQIARASLVLIVNETNSRPYGLLEDVFVDDEHRGKGHGTELIGIVVQVAKDERCYKLIATSRYSRPAVHALYVRLGFRDHGKEFRMELTA